MRARATPWFRRTVGIVASFGLTLVPIAAPAAAQPIPQLALWESHMTSFGQTHYDYLAQSHTFDEKLTNVYYDGERVESIYRDQDVLPNSGNVPGTWNFTHGLTMDYLRTGDASSRTVVIQLSQNAAFAVDGTALSSTVSAWLSREVAYTIMSYINAEKVGAAPRARLPQLVGQASGHMDQCFISKSKDGCNSIDDNTACPLAVVGYKDNQWQRVVFVVDASGAKFYDGLPQAALPWTGTPGAPTTTQALRIDHYPGLSSRGFFSGVIDDVRIWSNAWPNGLPMCELEIDTGAVALATHVIADEATPPHAPTPRALDVLSCQSA